MDAGKGRGTEKNCTGCNEVNFMQIGKNMLNNI